MDLNIAIELHDVATIKAILASGVEDPNPNGNPLLWLLIGEYTRSPRFQDCVREFLDAGFRGDDPILEATLLDDVELLKEAIQAFPDGIHRHYTLPCAYTPFFEVSLLHLCAEFNHVSCAEALIKAGLNINATAGIDEFGFGGQTPIFHTV